MAHAQLIDSRQDARAANAGDILMARLQVRGVAGCVTDGGMRDSPAIAELGFPVYQARPSPPISLLHHFAVDMNVPVACGGAAVFPGDIIVGDGEGVVVVPAAIADQVARDAVEMTVYEDFVAEQVIERGASIFGLYPASDESRVMFAEWRKAKGR